MKFIKVSKEPIPIHYLQDEDDRYNCQPSFMFGGNRYWLKDFIRIKNSPWVKQDYFPEYLDAFQGNEYHFPLYISLVGSESVDVYIHKGDDSQ